MLSADSKPITRKWAIALIIITLLRVASPFVAYYQTKTNLVSDFIPKGIIIDIIAPYMMMGIFCVVVTLAAFIFFIYSRFVYAIITCCAGIILIQILPYFIY